MNQFESILQDLISLVELATPKLWGIAIKQVYVLALGDLLGFIFFSMSAFFILRALKYYMVKIKNAKEGSYDKGFYEMLCTISIIVFWGLCFLSLYDIYSFITKLINPEYYAIQLLMDYVGM